MAAIGVMTLTVIGLGTWVDVFAVHHCGWPAESACDEPVLIWGWLHELCDRLGVEPPRGSIPLGVARIAGRVAEHAWTVMPLGGEPIVTRFLASALARFLVSVIKAPFEAQ